MMKTAGIVLSMMELEKSLNVIIGIFFFKKSFKQLCSYARWEHRANITPRLATLLKFLVTHCDVREIDYVQRILIHPAIVAHAAVIFKTVNNDTAIRGNRKLLLELVQIFKAAMCARQYSADYSDLISVSVEKLQDMLRHH
jgi:hypothetical protein